MKLHLALGFAFFLGFEMHATAQYFPYGETLSDPNAGNNNDGSPLDGTFANGIDGNNIVGYYTAANGVSQGFLYNDTGTTYTTLSDPVALSDDQSTYATGISGANIVGYYSTGSSQYGFLYSGSSYTTLSGPSGASNVFVEGISGNYVSGYYTGSGGVDYGFIYNIGTSTYTTVSNPASTLGTTLTGVSGNFAVGSYPTNGSGAVEGFLYNISNNTFTNLNNPLATGQSSGNGTYPYGLLVNSQGQDNIVGLYESTAPGGGRLVLLYWYKYYE